MTSTPGGRRDDLRPTDYGYRAFALHKLVAKSIAAQIWAIDYTNFKSSVSDIERRMAYTNPSGA